MRKIVLAFAVVLFAVFAGNAQIKFGPKVGMNLSTMTMKIKEGGISVDVNTKMLLGYHIGATFQADLASNFFLQPSILFSSKGSKYDAADNIKIVANYIDIPVNLGYKLNVGSIDILFLAGPYFAYGVGGYGEAEGEKADISWGSGDDDDFKPFDMGLNIGAGIEVNNFQFSMQYGVGLLNISPHSSITNKNNVLGISVAYLF